MDRAGDRISENEANASCPAPTLKVNLFLAWIEPATALRKMGRTPPNAPFEKSKLANISNPAIIFLVSILRVSVFQTKLPCFLGDVL
jgi:hypothetical protein